MKKTDWGYAFLALLAILTPRADAASRWNAYAPDMLVELKKGTEMKISTGSVFSDAEIPPVATNAGGTKLTDSEMEALCEE